MILNLKRISFMLMLAAATTFSVTSCGGDAEGSDDATEMNEGGEEGKCEEGKCEEGKCEEGKCGHGEEGMKCEEGKCEGGEGSEKKCEGGE